MKRSTKNRMPETKTMEPPFEREGGLAALSLTDEGQQRRLVPGWELREQGRGWEEARRIHLGN